jgi:hypothetical protein
MRRIQCAVIASLFVVGLAPVASAQPVSLTGFYAGGNIGYSFGNANSTYNEPAFGIFSLGSISDSAKLDGVLAVVKSVTTGRATARSSASRRISRALAKEAAAASTIPTLS